MLTVQPVPAAYPQLDALFDLIGPGRAARLRAAADRICARLDGGILWQVNSTAAGGGVAEMLHTVLPLYRALGVPVGWLVVGGDERFFAITKRLGVMLYGGAGGPLGPAERADYDTVLAANAAAARDIVGPQDVLLLHDFQTTGLANLLDGQVSASYWRCHVGVDVPNEPSTVAWRFLEPLLDKVSGTVFSVPEHVPAFLRDRPGSVLAPFLSPFAAKNCDLSPADIEACLAWCGLRPGPAVTAEVSTPDGPVRLRRPVRLVADRPPSGDEPFVIQVSRWDRLKDMHGVLAAFAGGVPEGYLALIGPDPAAIPDDIEQADWYARCVADRAALPAAVRERTALLCLPMDDLAENAVLVNALQRAADVIAQKSLAEGFGLTVTEAMVKARVVAASAVGGIRSQIRHGETGLLATDPTDLPAFGALLSSALDGSVDRATIGARARTWVLDRYLPDSDIIGTAALLTEREL
jgi:trehalose synthase